MVSLTRENIVAVNSDFAGAMNSEDEDERESSLTFIYAALPRTKKKSEPCPCVKSAFGMVLSCAIEG